MDVIIERLLGMQDLQYRNFVTKLTPSINKENIIGVRTPLLKTYAKELYNSPIKELFLKQLPHRY